MNFCRLLVFVSQSTFSKKQSFRNASIVSNNLDPGQARLNVVTDLVQNCSANDTRMQRVKSYIPGPGITMLP